MRDALFIALGGALGALSRHGVGVKMQRWLGPGFPYGTLTVNVLGCFLLALIMRSSPQVPWLGREARLLLATGFMGAFTTFSTFGYDTARLVESQRLGAAFGNVALNVLVGLCATALGWWLGGQLTGAAAPS